MSSTVCFFVPGGEWVRASYSGIIVKRAHRNVLVWSQMVLTRTVDSKQLVLVSIRYVTLAQYYGQRLYSDIKSSSTLAIFKNMIRKLDIESMLDNICNCCILRST